MYELLGLREVKSGEFFELHLKKSPAPGLKYGNTIVEKIFCRSDVCHGNIAVGCKVDIRYMPGFNGKAYVSEVEFK